MTAVVNTYYVFQAAGIIFGGDNDFTEAMLRAVAAAKELGVRVDVVKMRGFLKGWAGSADPEGTLHKALLR